MNPILTLTLAVALCLSAGASAAQGPSRAEVVQKRVAQLNAQNKEIKKGHKVAVSTVKVRVAPISTQASKSTLKVMPAKTKQLPAAPLAAGKGRPVSKMAIAQKSAPSAGRTQPGGIKVIVNEAAKNRSAK